MYAIIATALAALARDAASISFQPVAQCCAAMLRFAMTTDALDLYESRLCRARDSDEALLAPPGYATASCSGCRALVALLSPSFREFAAKLSLNPT